MTPLPSLDHLVRLSDDVGVIQHAFENVPNRSTGYCTDDVARALIVTLARQRIDTADGRAQRLAATYLAFLADAQLPDGRFHNFMSFDRRWLDEVGTHDSNGRAIWALGYAMRHSRDERQRRVAQALLGRALAALDWLEYPMSEAYAMLGLVHAEEGSPHREYSAALRRLAGRSRERLASWSVPGWTWFDDAMTYDVARLPEALLRAGKTLGDRAAIDAGLSALDFYEGVAFEGGIFVPIGNEGWYVRGAVRARYAQQPLEAAAMVDAQLAATDIGGGPRHRDAAEIAMAWYRGRNSEGIVMEHDGGCYDGLAAGEANRNMGAESTLALLAAAYALALRQRSRIAVA